MVLRFEAPLKHSQRPDKLHITGQGLGEREKELWGG